jgi:AraC family transcriptional regulator of adaptative response/methylated-DNA-[protein]-cysteine methyltransferase
MIMTATQSINETEAWNSVLARDGKLDGELFYAVTTTGVYCRPSCPSRRPNRENVNFFSSTEEAERAGFRACQRCRPDGALTAGEDAIQRARGFIDRHLSDLSEEMITLERLSVEAGLSPHHLQRKFKQLVGLTPAQYVRARKSERLKSELKRGETVSRATYGAGYGSSSRVYDRSTSLGMTPATYRRGGAGAHIDYVIARTSLGYLLVAGTHRGVCAVTLGDDASALEAALEREYPAAARTRVANPSSGFGVWVSTIVATIDGSQGRPDVPIDVQASAFQWKVWRELQKIPFGETRTYTEIATAVGAPRAARAVANACANNHVALVIPCHRVVRQGGELGGYRWGIERKRRLLDKESSARGRKTS